MGGKFRLKKRIIDLFPKDYENMIYIEPFVGGGSVYFSKEPSKEEIINYIDKDLIEFYKGFKKYDFDQIKKDVDGKYSKEEFYKIRDNIPKDKYNKFLRLFKLFRTSYFGLLRSYDRTKSISLRENYSERLKNTKIFNTDYKTIIKKYDSPNSLIYLDPPYEGSTKEHYKNSIIDYEELKNILSKIKGKFLLSINKSDRIKELFKNFNISEIKTEYVNPITGSKDKKTITEYIIKNY